MAFRVRFRKGGAINTKRVVGKIATTLLVLYVGGYFLTILGTTMEGTCSPFYSGLSLLGWLSGNNVTAVADANFADSDIVSGCLNSNNILYNTSNSGIMTVVGLLAIGSVVLEFVRFSL